MSAQMKTAPDKKPLKKNEPTIALAMIVKDDTEAKNFERCLKSSRRFFDGLYVTGTNKPDTKIQKLTQKYKGEYSFFKWTKDFSEARNFNLSQVPEHYDFFFWLDADDIIHDGHLIRQIAVQAKIGDWSSVYLPYWYQVDVDDEGNVTEIVIDHLRERLVRHDGTYKWVGPLHETIIEQRKENVTKYDLKEPVIIHLSTQERFSKNLDRNIEILEATIKKQNRKDPRTLIYLAKAYFDRGKFEEPDKKKIDFDLARLLFDEYLNGSGELWKDYREGSGWREERASAWAYMGDMARLEGRFNDSIIFGLNAIQEAPEFPNYYLDMGMTYAARKEWPKAEHWLKLFTTVPIPRTTMILNRRDLKTRALELDLQIALAKNELDRGIRSSAELHRILPKVPAVEQRHKQLLLTKETNQAAQSILYLGKYLEQTNQKDKIIPLINAIPDSMEPEPFVAQLRQRFLPARVWDKNEIAIYCGPGFEPWSPKSLNRDGMGGSEEAVVRLSKELTKLGYKVTVFAHPMAEYGDHDGVEYKQYYQMNAKDTFNILILWRAIGFASAGFNAKQTYLWMHDVPNNPDFIPERYDKINRIFALSEFHKSLLKFNVKGNGTEWLDAPDDKVFVTANGIAKTPIKDPKDRDPHRMIWTSSYDRGLVYLLKIWPQVLEAVPDAKLDITYGWDLFDKAYHDNPARQMWKRKVAKMMNQPGITHHGRVGQDKIVELTRKCGLWAYPTGFEEISCISAMKAQAYGAIPVTTDYAALKETVQYGEKVDVDITTEEGQDKYAEALIKALKDVDKQKEIRPEMMKWANKKFLWENVAKQWEAWFEEDKKKSNISLV